MNDLVKIHTYYIYSLESFTTVFHRGIDLVTAIPVEVEAEEKVEATDAELATRCIVLIDSITKTVFNYIRRGVFETDKLTVATLTTLRISVNDGKLSEEDVAYLVEAKQNPDPGNMGPLFEWLPPSIWPRVKL
jgi:dynein heavy chain